MKDIKVFPKKKNRRRCEYERDRYKNLTEDEKQSLGEYGKKYYKVLKNRTASQIKTD